MGDILDFLSAHRSGILILLLCLIVLVILAQWFAWIFSIGRFKSAKARSSGNNLRYIFSEAAVKLINDFRHLLALVIILIFAFALGYAMIEARASIADMKEALQAVVATLGGLVGSIIGYYFGESSVIKPLEPGLPGGSAARGEPTPAVQEPITPAPPPPDQLSDAS